MSGGVVCFFFFQAEDGIRDFHVTGVQTCALPIYCSQLIDVTDNFSTVSDLCAESNPTASAREAEGERLGELDDILRSEERRVGKECRSRGSTEQENKTIQKKTV